MKISKAYSSKNYINYSFIIALSLFSAFLSPQLNTAVLAIALVLSFYSAKYAIISISLSWLLTSLNPGIFESSSINIFLKQGIYFATLAGVALRGGQYGDRGLFTKAQGAVLVFACFVIVNSIFVSYYPVVSILKVVLFTIGLLSVMLCYRELSPDKWQDIEEWFISLFIVITIVSLPLIVMTYGYTRNGSGFQGILNHPQLFGTIYAVFTAFVAGRMWQFKRYRWDYVLLTILGIAYIYFSESRTGLLGLVLSFGFAILFSFQKSVKIFLLNKKFVIPIFVLAIIIIPYYGQIASGLTDFLLKSQQYEQVDEALQASRGNLFLASYNNFLENPVIGNGFGIASDPLSMQIERDPILGMPISASIEKGVVPMALLEENGLFGSFIFFVFLYYLARKPFRQKEFYLIWPILAVLAINLGESAIFSFNAWAGILWLIILHHVKRSSFNA